MGRKRYDTTRLALNALVGLLLMANLYALGIRDPSALFAFAAGVWLAVFVAGGCEAG